jgi:hypothetical protein
VWRRVVKQVTRQGTPLSSPAPPGVLTIYTLPATKCFLLTLPRISSKHPEVPFSQEGEFLSVKFKRCGYNLIKKY